MELLLVSCDLSETVRADLTPFDESWSSNEDKLSDLFLENVARDSGPNSRCSKAAWLQLWSVTALGTTGFTCDDRVWETSALNNRDDFVIKSTKLPFWDLFKRLGTDFALSGNDRSSNKCSDDSDLSSLQDEGDSNSSSPETTVPSLVSRVGKNSPSRKLPLLAEETSLSSNELFDSLSGDLLRENWLIIWNDEEPTKAVL